jgi:hypothetical protein
MQVGDRMAWGNKLALVKDMLALGRLEEGKLDLDRLV